MSTRAEQLPLREKFTAAEHLVRDLIEHLDHGVLPKIQHLEELVTVSNDSKPATDLTVRTQAAALLESDEFTQQLCEKIEEFLKAINHSVDCQVNE